MVVMEDLVEIQDMAMEGMEASQVMEDMVEDMDMEASEVAAIMVTVIIMLMAASLIIHIVIMRDMEDTI
jgi:hypothetical protein